MVKNFYIARGELENGNDLVVELSQKGEFFTVIGYIRDYHESGADLDLFRLIFDDLEDAKECFSKIKEKINF